MRAAFIMFGYAFVMFLSTFSLDGCLMRRQGLGGEGSTVSATIDGLEEGDAERLKNIKYKLVCKSKFESMGRLTDDGRVKFSDDGLLANDECALEVHADKEGSNTYRYVWLSRPPVEGLFYSSDLAKVRTLQDQNGKLVNVLAFKLFKVYGLEYTDSFAANVNVEFVLEDGAVIPADVEMVANLRCANNKSYPSAAVTGVSEKVRKFTFNLSASLMKNLECNEVVIAKNNFAIYRGELAKVRFETPKKGETLNFNGPFKVTTTEEVLGNIVCTGKENGRCVSVRLPRPERNAWFAVIHMVKDDDDKLGTSYILMDSVLGSNSDGNALSIINIHQEIMNTTKYSWFALAAEAALTAADYNHGAIESAIAPHKISASTIANMQLSYFERIQIHGFKTVTEGTLNSKASARWLVQLKATNPKGSEEYFVSGIDKYFGTTKGSSAKYFDLDALRADPSKYSIYGYRGSAAKPESCDLTTSFYVDAMSAKSQAEISGTPTNGLLDACQITAKEQLQSLKGSWSFRPTFFLWGWHSHSF